MLWAEIYVERLYEAYYGSQAKRHRDRASRLRGGPKLLILRRPPHAFLEELLETMSSHASPLPRDWLLILVYDVHTKKGLRMIRSPALES